MAYKQQRTRYEFTDTAKASMIMYLDQFPEHMETINQIKASLTVPGAFLLDTYEAVILASLIRDYWPTYADKLMLPLVPYVRITAEEGEAAHNKIVRRLQGYVD